MGTDRSATPEEQLQALADGHADLLEGLARMPLGTLERSRLDEGTYLLVRLAALVATDAGPASYRAHLGRSGDLALPTAKVLAVFVAVAPLVGSARVLSAASELSRAGLLAGPPESSWLGPE